MTPPLADRQQQDAREAYEVALESDARMAWPDTIYAVYAAGMREGWNGAVDAAAKIVGGANPTARSYAKAIRALRDKFNHDAGGTGE